jgi:hypothetical protein
VGEVGGGREQEAAAASTGLTVDPLDAATSTGFAGGGGGASTALTVDPLDAAVGVGCSASGSLGGATSTGASPAAARSRRVPRRPARRRGKGRRWRWRCVWGLAPARSGLRDAGRGEKVEVAMAMEGGGWLAGGEEGAGVSE